METVYRLINKSYQLLVPLIVLGLGVQCTLTTMDNRKLKNQIQSKWGNSGPSIQMANVEALKPGEKIESFTAVDIAGVEHKVGGAKKTILLAFTTTCPVCKANGGNWNTLYEKLNKDNWDVIGLSSHDVEKTKAYAQEHGFKFPIISMTEKKDVLTKLKIFRVPTTLVIDQDLKVQKVWTGNLESLKDEVNKTLEI